MTPAARTGGTALAASTGGTAPAARTMAARSLIRMIHHVGMEQT